eukprot:244002-Ditylum_brightwellii.AAC.1
MGIDPTGASREKITEAHEASQEAFVAYALLAEANKKLHGNIETDLSNAFLKGAKSMVTLTTFGLNLYSWLQHIVQHS